MNILSIIAVVTGICILAVLTGCLFFLYRILKESRYIADALKLRDIDTLNSMNIIETGKTSRVNTPNDKTSHEPKNENQTFENISTQSVIICRSCYHPTPENSKKCMNCNALLDNRR